MKKTLQNFLFCLFIIIAIDVSAQPKITAAGGIPVLGDKYLIQATYISPNNAPKTSGANQVWDYSNLADSSTAGIVSMVSPSGLPGATKFPTANIAWQDPIQGSYIYSNNQSKTTFGELGEYTTATNWGTFSPQLTRVSFPMTYGTTYADTASFIGATTTGFYIKVYDTLTADGYGTLKLPHNASYNNILRIKVALTLVLYYNGAPFTTTTSYFYQYVQEGIHYPILELSTSANNFSAQYYAGIPVPLLISNFNSNWKNNVPNLQWNASNTANTKQFNVERSFDGKTFTNVGTVSVTGNSTYQFTDNSYQAGIVYYRLQQLDKDGSVYYSDITKLQSIETDAIKVWPNPSVDKVHLSLSSSGKYHVVIYDFTGKKVYENKVFTSNNVISTDKWSKGTYVVKVKDNAGWKTNSFEKL